MATSKKKKRPTFSRERMMDILCFTIKW